MAKKKAKGARAKSGGEWKPAWKTPTEGVHPELTGMGLRFTAEYRAAVQASDLIDAIRGVMPILLNLLGDHTVELEVGKALPSAHGCGLEFDDSGYRCTVKCMLAELTHAEPWRVLAENFEGGVHGICASRGGGKTLRRIWSIAWDGLDASGSIRNLGGGCFFSFTVEAQHVVPGGADDWSHWSVRAKPQLSKKERLTSWQGLMETFFEASSTVAGFVQGGGELTHVRRVRFGSGHEVLSRLGHSRVLSALQLPRQADDLRIVVPTAATVLGPDQCARLGGAEAVVARAHSESASHDEDTVWGLRVKKLGSGMLIQFESIGEWIENDSPDFEYELLWVMSLLNEAGLLKQINATTKSEVAEHFADERRLLVEEQNLIIGMGLGSRLKSDSKVIRDSAAGDAPFTPPTARPACVCSARSVIEDCPDDEFVRENVVCWRVRPREGPVDAGLTVYARHSAELGQLIAPVLVGSLDAERAALAFHPRVHGYDAMCEAAESPEGKRREASYGRLKQAVCAKCQCRVFQVWAALEYPDDLEEGDLGAGAKVEEWFSWFWLVTKCASCGEVQAVVDHECA